MELLKGCRVLPLFEHEFCQVEARIMKLWEIAQRADIFAPRFFKIPSQIVADCQVVTCLAVFRLKFQDTLQVERCFGRSVTEHQQYAEIIIRGAVKRSSIEHLSQLFFCLGKLAALEVQKPKL